MKKYILTLFALIFAFSAANAQEFTISGIVTDTEDEPLAGVAVIIQETKEGTMTDGKGRYTIEAEEGQTLEFSFIGMVTQNVTIGKRSVIDIQMTESAIFLDEAVAIGYGVAKKSDLTGAVASVKAEDLQTAKIGTVTSALQGLATGVHVTTGSVKPGGDASVIIRGNSTFKSDSTPLYIVDGMPVQGGLQDLSSSDIQSIEILKDASSAAIYGSRGANGVVLITTKKGTADKMRISLNASYGTQRMLNKQDLMNAQQYYDLVSYAQPDDYTWTSEELRLLSRGESTDWQDAITQNGSYQNYNFSISGGSEKIQHYFGLDYYDQIGIIKNSSFNKLTARYNMDAKMNDWFRYGVRFNVIESTLKNINEESDPLYGTMFSAISAQPTAPIFTKDGEYFDGFLNTKANPVAIVDLLDRTTLKSRVVGSFYLEIEPIKNLRIRSDNGGELVFYRVNEYEDERMGQHYTEGGHAKVTANKKRYWQTENTVTYDMNIEDTHKLTVMAGFSASRTEFEQTIADSKKLSAILKYYNLGGAEEHGPNESNAVTSSLVSFYGRATYNYKDRYLATVTMRGDGSSRFAPGHRWGFFPSAALAWRISEESFVKDNVKWISNLKLRASAGMLGNQEIGDFQYAALIDLGDPTANYVFGNNLASGAQQINISNPELTWEKSNQYDIAIDFGFLDNRIAGTIEGYYKRTSDLLWEVPLPLESGFNTSLTNIGKVDNRGIEFSISTVNISTRDFSWTTALNFSVNQNEIMELYNGKTDVNKDLFVGKPISDWYLLKNLGIWQVNEAAEAAKYGAQPGDRKVWDKNGDYVINGDDRDFCGQSTPKWYGSFNTAFNFKGFDLSAFFTFAGGHYINNDLRRFLDSYNVWGNMSENYYKYYWREDRPNNRYPAPRVGSAYANGDGTDANLEKGDYLRLRNLELGYTFSKKMLKIMNMRVYVAVQNVFTATEFTGYDVESSSNSNPYPNARSFIGGISINF